MKKILTLALVWLTRATAGAQTVYDATNIAQKELNGTARFVGMGGALGALGGDISTIGTNPAGIGIYRSNDLMISAGYGITSAESNYLGSKQTMDKYRWSLDNVGFVLAMKVGNETPLRYMNFGFNYHKSKSLYKNMTMQGLMGSFDGYFLSQANSMAQQANDCEMFSFNSSDFLYNNNSVGWLGIMGYDGYATDIDADGYSVPYVPDEADSYFRSQERGGVDEFDFNVAFNVNDRFYFGITIGAYDVDYHKYSCYDEDYGNGEGYLLESFNRIHGTGFDVKFGAIVRPFEESPLRIGLAIHTPTYYKLTYTTGALLNSDYYLPDDAGQEVYTNTTVDTYSALGGRDMDRDFDLQTPWVFNASLGYTVGKTLALGAEYEYEDYSSMKFKYPEGGEMAWETGEADLCLKGVHTLRLGAEYKPIPEFALRAGYNYSTSAYRSDAIKALPANSINTDTDFANSKTMNTFTIGMGYRFSSFYADLAYKYDLYKADFYPFYNDFNGYLVTPQATEVTNSRSKVTFTLGYRF